MLLHLSIVAGLVGYVVAAVLFTLGLVRRSANLERHAKHWLLAGWSAHTLAALLHVIESGEQVLIGRGDQLLLISWALVLLFVLLHKKLESPIAGAVISPAAVLLLGSSSIIVHGGVAGQSAGLDLMLLLIHVVPAILADICILFALIISVVFLFQERRLKKKKVDLMSLRGPNLSTLGSLHGRAVLAGFLALSFAVVTGSVWGLSQGRILLRNDLVQWSALLSWLILAAILHMRFSSASERRISKVTVLMCGCFVVGWLLVAIFYGNVMHAV